MRLQLGFVISQDPQRSERTHSELASSGLEIHHWPGVKGSEERESSDLTIFCARFCTDHIIGCGLAHKRLAEALLGGVIGEEDVVLVCEDDVKTLSPLTLQSDLQQIAAGMSATTDILLLHSIGNNCRSHGAYEELGRLWRGSAAAYLASLSGLKKIAQYPVMYHIDLQRNSLAFASECGPQLFDTFDSKTPPVLFGQSWVFWIGQPIVRLGSLDLLLGHLVLIFACLLFLWPSTGLKKHVMAALTGVLLGASVFLNLDIYWYRCSLLASLFGCLFPIAVIMTSRHFLVLAGAYSMLTFHFLQLWTPSLQD